MASFDIPTNLYPTSSSGINWSGPAASGVATQIPKLAAELPKLVSDYGSLARTNINRQTTQLLGPQAFQGTLNKLASRGVLNGGVASDALSKTASEILKNAQTLGYQSDLDTLKAKIALPSSLGDIAKLDLTSTSTNPLAPYQLMADILQSPIFA